MANMDIRIPKSKYRNVFIVQNRAYWQACPFEYAKDQDLVLSLDFAVVQMVRKAGGDAQYLDHIANSDVLEQYNYKTYEFLASWFCNASGEDIFSYRGIDFGSVYRIEILSDITCFVRLFVNLQMFFAKVECEAVYLGMDNTSVSNVLECLRTKIIQWSAITDKNTVEYSFPIFRLMTEALHPTTIKYKLKVRVIEIVHRLLRFLEKQNFKSKIIYIERYYPTEGIIAALRKSKNVKMVRSDFYSISDMFSGTHLPTFYLIPVADHDAAARRLFEKFDRGKCSSFCIDEYDLSNKLYALIRERISMLVPNTLAMTDAVINFLSDKKLSLMVTFSSLGVLNRLMINYCKKNGIPVYMIINGLLANSFFDEAKDGTWINAYGDSVKVHYFKGMDNIVCLGDPRMDKYTHDSLKRQINHTKPTIVIGASLFSNVDLNSYFAVEFEFLHDILAACRRLQESGKGMDIIIKLRSNNYAEQYQSFLTEYFPNIPVTLVANKPMLEVFETCDLYISLASQTLFEASCLGIPVIYYKNDTHFYHTPFDGKSELVTAYTTDDLMQKIEAFYGRDPIYDAFKDKTAMEKYIGPLDGRNLERNMQFIHSLIETPGQNLPL
ncbi:hypothetical protein ACFL43_00195 [Thermodesulfobacteriota bacterium]